MVKYFTHIPYFVHMNRHILRILLQNSTSLDNKNTSSAHPQTRCCFVSGSAGLLFKYVTYILKQELTSTILDCYTSAASQLNEVSKLNLMLNCNNLYVTLSCVQ